MRGIQTVRVSAIQKTRGFFMPLFNSGLFLPCPLHNTYTRTHAHTHTSARAHSFFLLTWPIIYSGAICLTLFKTIK
jgi:hypothetical protein